MLCCILFILALSCTVPHSSLLWHTSSIICHICMLLSRTMVSLCHCCHKMFALNLTWIRIFFPVIINISTNLLEIINHNFVQFLAAVVYFTKIMGIKNCFRFEMKLLTLQEVLQKLCMICMKLSLMNCSHLVWGTYRHSHIKLSTKCCLTSGYLIDF